MSNSQPELFGSPAFKISHEANPDFCKSCHSAIWTLLSREGFKVHLDVRPITPLQDRDLYLAKIPTFRVWRSGETFEVDFRTKLLIISDDGKRPVLIRHECTMIDRATSHPDYFAKPKKETK